MKERKEVFAEYDELTESIGTSWEELKAAEKRLAVVKENGATLKELRSNIQRFENELGISPNVPNDKIETYIPRMTEVSKRSEKLAKRIVTRINVWQVLQCGSQVGSSRVVHTLS